MSENIVDIARKYKILNKMAVKNEMVVFGSTSALVFPFYEFMRNKITDYVIYNRSISNLKVKQAKEVVEDCLKYLEPKRVLLYFEENETFDKNYYSDYEKLIAKIKQINKSTSICILHSKDINDDLLKKTVEKFGINELKINEGEDEEKIFSKVSGFFHDKRISLLDAFYV